MYVNMLANGAVCIVAMHIKKPHLFYEKVGLVVRLCFSLRIAYFQLSSRQSEYEDRQNEPLLGQLLKMV